MTCATLSLALSLALAAPQELRAPTRAYRVMPDVRRPSCELPPLPRPAQPRRRMGVRDTLTAGGVEASREAAALPAPARAVEGPPTLHFDVDEEGRHWVRGARYKASFGPEGATFVPFLGSSAPANEPVRFALAGAYQGAREASLVTPRVRRDGDRLVLDHGAVRAEYVPGLDGLEQLFVLDAPLAPGATALELHMTVDTALTWAEDGAGWRFAGERGGVAYGAAVVLDARGQRLAIAAERRAGGLAFTIPASFLAGAVWPIAVDPLITPIAVDIGPADHLDVDVAFDPTRGRYLVVFSEVFSATDYDIKSWLVDASGAVVPASDRYFDFTATHRIGPRVAMTDARRAFLCVYVEGASARRIGARGLLADSNALGPRFLVDTATANDRSLADVCGDSYGGNPSDAHFTVVWRRLWDPTDSDIVARVMHEDGVPITGELYVTNIVGIADRFPAISKCIAPGTQDSVVVWRRGDEVLGALVSFDGGAITPEFSLAVAAGPIGRPNVSALSTATLLGSAQPTFVAVWDTTYGTERDVEAVVAAASNTLAVPLVSDVQYLSFLEHVDFSLDQREPDVACVGEEWIIVQNATFPGALDSVTRATTVGIVATELGVSERFLPLTQTFEETFTPRIASRFEAGDVGSLEALTAWDQLIGFTPPGSVYAAIHAAPQARPCAIQYGQCIGNPNGTYLFHRSFLWVEGDASVTGTKRLHAVDIHANAFGYFLAAPFVSTTGGVAPPGSVGILCLTGPIGRFSNSVLHSGPAGTFSLDFDPAAIPQPTGAVPALAGQLWFFQAWHRDVRPGGGPPTSNFTNAAGLPFY